MATAQNLPNIWAQMSYHPPRGPCSLKTSVLSTCACHRFMIHPLKAPSSYDCDGCGHHASFHQMESLEDERVVRRWRGEGRGMIGRGEGGGMGRIAMGIDGGIGGLAGLRTEGVGREGIEEARKVKRLMAVKEMKRVDGAVERRFNDIEDVEELDSDAYEDGEAVLHGIITEGEKRWSAAVAEGAKRRKTAKMAEKEVVEVLDGEDRGDEGLGNGRTGKKRKGRGG